MYISPQIILFSHPLPSNYLYMLVARIKNQRSPNIFLIQNKNKIINWAVLGMDLGPQFVVLQKVQTMPHDLRQSKDVQKKKRHIALELLPVTGHAETHFFRDLLIYSPTQPPSLQQPRTLLLTCTGSTGGLRKTLP